MKRSVQYSSNVRSSNVETDKYLIYHFILSLVNRNINNCYSYKGLGLELCWYTISSPCHMEKIKVCLLCTYPSINNWSMDMHRLLQEQKPIPYHVQSSEAAARAVSSLVVKYLFTLLPSELNFVNFNIHPSYQTLESYTSND